LYRRGEEARAATQEYKDVQRKLEEKYAEWNSLTDRIVRLEREG